MYCEVESFFIISLYLLSFPIVCGEVLRIATPIQQEAPLYKAISQFYIEVTKNISDLEIVLVYYPRERTVKDVVSGKLDGDSGRILSVYRDHTRIISLRGEVSSENFFKQNNLSYSLVNSSEAAFMMLVSNRADFFLSHSALINQLIQNGYENKIFLSRDIIYTSHMYLFINKKHEKWLKPLEESIRTLNDTGRTMEIFNPQGNVRPAK